jgi:hypothetical protein
MDTPVDRRINDELKKRFVLSLKEVMFMGLFSKKAKQLNYYFGTLQGLAYLEPHLIIPGALQRFYPFIARAGRSSPNAVISLWFTVDRHHYLETQRSAVSHHSTLSLGIAWN